MSVLTTIKTIPGGTRLCCPNQITTTVRQRRQFRANFARSDALPLLLLSSWITPACALNSA
jgi:hypothetical protein